MKQESKQLQIERATIADDEYTPSKTIRVLQSGHLGDLLYSMSWVKRAAEVNNAKVVFNVGFNEVSGTPNHPSGKFCINDNTYNYIKPLLEYQSYISKVQKHDHHLVNYNFDQFRRLGLNLAAGDLKRNHGYVYPELQHDLSAPCIQAPKDKQYKDVIVINLTDRYRNPKVDYRVLGNYHIVFVGLDHEYDNFCQKYYLKPERIMIENALQMATLLNSCKLFIGNQSSTFAIAEGLKINRMLEVYTPCPNVMPMGANGYDYINQHGLETLLKKLTN